MRNQNSRIENFKTKDFEVWSKNLLHSIFIKKTVCTSFLYNNKLGFSL